jgi:hypothetical protein
VGAAAYLLVRDTVGRLGLGIDYGTFMRESYYKITIPDLQSRGLSITQLVRQVNLELRVFLTYFPSEGWPPRLTR